MTAFDQAWPLTKMGKVYRGGEKGSYPEYWALDPDVATSFALGGHFGDQMRLPRDLMAHDDPRLDTDAMDQIMREYYSHGQQRPENLVENTLGRIEDDWGYAETPEGRQANVRQVFNDAGRMSPHEMGDYWRQHLRDPNRGAIGDRPPALGQREIEFLQSGPVGLFPEPQQQTRYKGQSEMFMDQISDKQQPSQEASDYAGGADARRILLERLIPDDQLGAEIQRPLMAQTLREYIASQQGVGGGGQGFGRHSPETKAFKQALRDAGLEWLGYMDRDPLNALTLQHIGDAGSRGEWPESERLWESDPDETQDDMEDDMQQCPECLKLVPTQFGNEDQYGDLWCDECFMNREEEEDDW